MQHSAKAQKGNNCTNG